MCGIAGKLYHDAGRTVDQALLDRMHTILRHRGPDDVGTYRAGPVGLAHRRLAIIDLSPAGRQPMANAAGTLQIVFNGEIYNYRELRAALEASGVTFRTSTDTEAILALYERHGTAGFASLRGMFALALWDTPARQLVLARDRLGKKPLCYYHGRDALRFASEPKAIFEDPEVPVAANDEAIHHYLSYGYVPSPWSAFRGVAKLPPGHVLVARDGTIDVQPYWRLSYVPKARLSDAEACEAFLAELRESVRLRMISDVPLGALLSGGLDSSTVVALMAEMSPRAVKTFSIGFEDETYNELPWARLVAQRFGTDHHEFVVKPNAVEILPELVWHYNEPFADSSAIPSYYLAQMARQHVTVALNGDGGDENFAGYRRHFAYRLAGTYDRLPGAVRGAFEAAAALLPDRGGPRSLYRFGRRFLAAAGGDAPRRYARWVGVFDAAAKAALYTPAFAAATAGWDSGALMVRALAGHDGDDLDAVLGADVTTYLPDDLLVKMDIASMAHSLEARSPFVDHVFMEWAAALPSSLKLRGRTGKYVFRRAVAPLLPAAILARPKMGFAVPLARWFRAEMYDLAHDTLLGRRAVERGLFEKAAVERLLADHVSGRRETHAQLWALLFLELWFARFIDGASARGTGR